MIHDLGTLICDGRKVEHTFRIPNHLSSPLRVTRATALVPCCSALGPMPSTISAGGSIEVPAVLNVGTTPGPKRVRFLIQLDSPASSSIMLELGADLVAKEECRPLDPGVRSLATKGRSRRWRWLVTTRRANAEGRAAPMTVSTSESIRAEFAGPPRVQRSGDGLTRVDREIDVVLPESRSSGHHQAEMVIGCEDGTSLKESIAWEVEDVFRVAPSGLVLFRQDGLSIKSFLIECSDRPFRIEGVDNPMSGRASAADNAESRHSRRLDVELDPARAEPGKRYDVVVRTDHPDRPEVAISILVLDRAPGDER